jgi:protein SCO1/2
MATANDPFNPTRPVRAPRRIGMALGLVAAAAALVFLSTRTPPALETSGAITTLTPPLELPAFSLETAGQTPITRDSLKGQWTLISLGFTSCPDICPNTLALLSRAVSQLRTPTGDVQVLFVSVDPERDTPQKLETYSKHFGEFVLGATGSHEQLLALTKPLGLFYEQDNAGADPSQYNVQHSTTVLLVGPDAEVVALIRSGEVEASEIAAALEGLRESA